MPHPRGVTSFAGKISKEAAALVAAACLVAGSLVLAQQDGASRTIIGRSTGPDTAVAVNSSSVDGAAAAWNATSLRTLPGEILVLPPSSSPGCPDLTVDASRASGAIAETVVCAAGDTARVTASATSLREAADAVRGGSGAMVLLGDGWTVKPPVPIDPSQMGNPGAVARALKDAQLAGAVVDLSGIRVVVAGPQPTTVVKRIWDAYFSAAGAAGVEWAVS